MKPPKLFSGYSPWLWRTTFSSNQLVDRRESQQKNGYHQSNLRTPGLFNCGMTRSVSPVTWKKSTRTTREFDKKSPKLSKTLSKKRRRYIAVKESKNSHQVSLEARTNENNWAKSAIESWLANWFKTIRLRNRRPYHSVPVVFMVSGFGCRNSGKRLLYNIASSNSRLGAFRTFNKNESNLSTEEMELPGKTDHMRRSLLSLTVRWQQTFQTASLGRLTNGHKILNTSGQWFSRAHQTEVSGCLVLCANRVVYIAARCAFLSTLCGRLTTLF